MEKPLFKIIKEYPVHGPLKQFRFEKTLSFNCSRCGKNKTSKLISTYNNSWSNKICNGCYGLLLHIYQIKISSNSIEERADQLLAVLDKLVDANRVEIQNSKAIFRQNQADYLSPSTLKFYMTAEFVAASLHQESNLEWSPAVIAICKALEHELIEKLINGLKQLCVDTCIPDEETKDSDFGKLVSYCIGKQPVPPELGSIARFLRTAMNSKKRIDSSTFLNQVLLSFLSKRAHADWLVSHNGLAPKLETLTNRYRNKAAHTTELSSADYRECRDLVFGNSGIMWDLINSTSTSK